MLRATSMDLNPPIMVRIAVDMPKAMTAVAMSTSMMVKPRFLRTRGGRGSGTVVIGSKTTV